MRIQSINPPHSDRYAPDMNDRAWLVMLNGGSGSTGLLQARAGDATCLHLDSTAAATYTDAAGLTQLCGYEAIECEATNAPVHALLGAWHDTPAVGGWGRVQCHGFDDDALLKPHATTPVTGQGAIAVDGEPHVQETASIESTASGNLCILAEIVAANHIVAGAAAGNHRVFWRCC